jgi:anti-sigma factor RsiW
MTMHDPNADEELTRALERLPRRAAPRALREAIEARVAESAEGARTSEQPEARVSNVRRLRVAATIVLFAAVAALGIVWLRGRAPATDAIAFEAVNDHLRVLYSEHPVEVASGGIHQVKPWFAGRLDFAPIVAFSGDDEFPLDGGSVAYFIDRKAAAFVFHRRLHVVTLFVFRAEGLSWSSAGARRIGRIDARVQTTRGFHVVTWRDGDLGYALVSDVDAAELTTLAQRVAGG